MKRCARRGCSNWFVPRKSGKPQKYCCNNCAQIHWRHMKAERNGQNLPVFGPESALTAFVCKNGHERTPENTKIDPDGSRRCRICKRNWEREYHQKAENRAKRKVYMKAYHQRRREAARGTR